MRTVTRQRQWPDGNLVVEISDGGIDYSNPGALVANYEGEMEEYEDPREAVEVAINIALAWQKDWPEEIILIDHGATGGYTMPFDGMELTEETFAELREWAAKEWEKVPKCAECGGLFERKRGELVKYGDWNFDEYDCCSEYCAERRYAPIEEDEEGGE